MLRRISIITPSYNQANFLEETILSVLNQNYPNLEYIIMDGGSTDGSLEIIRKYETQISYWESAPDRGQAHAINKGLQHASGEIVAWLNSDDKYLPGTLVQVDKAFCRHPDAQVIYGEAQYVDPDGFGMGMYCAKKVALPGMLHYDPIPQPAAFIKKSAFVKVGGLDEQYHFCLDYDLFLRLAIRGKFRFIPKTLATYRVHPASKSSRMQSTRWEETILIFKNIFSRNDLPKKWKRWYPDCLGRAHWQACLEYFRQGNHEAARMHSQHGFRFAPGFLESREFIELLVGSHASETQESNFDQIKLFFESIVGNPTISSRGLKLAIARLNALLSINHQVAKHKAQMYARKAIQQDPYWVMNRYVVKTALLGR